MEEVIRLLTIDSDELYFSAAHWIPEHPQCGVLHGHTFYVKGLEVKVSGFVDFGDIKAAIKSFDHLTIVPEKDSTAWCDLLERIKDDPLLSKLRKVFSKHRMIIDTDVPGTTVERIAEELKGQIEDIKGVVEAHFILTEGPSAGTEV